VYPNLRIQLWKAGIRQNRLAKMLDMDETLLSRIVNGYRQPSAEFRKKISTILHSDEVWLFDEVDGPAPEEPPPPASKAATQES
jgi:transcriptional regulator with XRE-family HTH domain